MTKDNAPRQMGVSMRDLQKASQEKAASLTARLGRVPSGLPGVGPSEEDEIVIPQREKKTISDETARELQRLHAAQANPPKETAEEKRAREAAAKLAEEEREQDAKTKAAVDDALRAMSQNEVVGDILDAQNPQHPFMDPILIKQIEEHLRPIDLSEALFGRATQTVPVIPGVMEVDFQAIKSKESLLIEHMLRDTGSETVRYYMQMSVVYLLAVAVKEIRAAGHVERLPPLMNDAGKVTTETIQARADVIKEFSTDVVSLLSAHYLWFEGRVRKLLTPQAVKNG